MKRIAKILTCMLLTVLIILPIGSFAVETADTKDIKEGKCGANAFWKLDMSTGELTVYGTGPTDHFYNDNLADYEGYVVDFDPKYTIEYHRSLPRPGFYQYKDSIQTIVVEYGITELGRSMFLELDKCKSVVLPDSLLIIHPACFAMCTELETINLPESLTRIGYYAFAVSKSLKNIKWPSGVAVIEKGTFTNSGELILEIPRTVTDILGTASLGFAPTKVLFIPNSLEGGKYSFGEMRMEEVVFEEGFTEIDTFFDGCPDLRRIIIPATVKKINLDLLGMYVYDVQICFCGTDEEWSKIVTNFDKGDFSDELYRYYYDRLTKNVVINYEYDCSGPDADTSKSTDIIDDTTATESETLSESSIDTQKNNVNNKPSDTGMTTGFESVIIAILISSVACVIIVVYKMRRKKCK